jgi:multiple sugar transport system permease protein
MADHPPRQVQWQHHDAWLGVFLVMPACLWLAATLVYPLVASVDLSFKDVRIIGTPGAYVGLKNFVQVLGDWSFWAAVGRSAIWVTGNAVVQTPLALAAALILAGRFRGVQIARVWIILPWVVPTVVVVIIWRWLFSTSGGMINPLLMELGLVRKPVAFFATTGAAMSTLILINSWRWFPFMAVMILAALLRVPADLYEAAELDGANAWQRFRHITWPLLKPTLAVLGAVGTLLSFNVFDIVWLMTGGGPLAGTTTVPLLIYETAFKAYRLSEAAAMSVITSIALMALALMATRRLAETVEK